MTAVSVFGLGYVGCVSVACLAAAGHSVIGVDVNPTKVDMLNRGESPIVEEGLADLLDEGVRSGRVRATHDVCDAVSNTELSLICVGTPSTPSGSLNLAFVERVCRTLGKALGEKSEYHVVAARSTMLPGGTEGTVIPALEQESGKKVGSDFGVCFNPEFLREGTSIKDFFDPPFTIVGATDERAAASVSDLYAAIDRPLHVVPYKVAEMVKYASNAYHAVKVCFANEIGNLCKLEGIDSYAVMDIFCQDTKLNVSRAYLKPGFAFGGSCLPKDLRAMLYHSRHLDLHPPLLESILPSNQRQIDLAYQMIKKTGGRRIGVLGFSFKEGTDDLRESPVVELIEYLIGKGYKISLYDKNVSLAALHGANRVYIETEIPHIACLMKDSVDDVLDNSEVIVVGNGSPEFVNVLDRIQEGQILIDLVRNGRTKVPSNGKYHGICW